MKKIILFIIICLLQLSCSKSDSEQNDPYSNEEKVLIVGQPIVIYVGVKSGKIYNVKSTNHFNFGIFSKSDDAFYAVETSGKEIRIIPAEQFRSNMELTSFEESILQVNNLEGFQISKIFLEQDGYLHVLYNTMTGVPTQGIGKINLSTNEFESLHSGFYYDPIAWANYHYDSLDKILYRFENSFGLKLTNGVNIVDGSNEIINKEFGDIDLSTTIPTFESSINHDFYFTKRLDTNPLLYKFNTQSKEMINLGHLPTDRNNMMDYYFVNSKNKVYYTSFLGSGSSICSFDFSTNAKTEVSIKGNSITGTINSSDQIIFID